MRKPTERPEKIQLTVVGDLQTCWASTGRVGPVMELKIPIATLL